MMKRNAFLALILTGCAIAVFVAHDDNSVLQPMTSAAVQFPFVGNSATSSQATSDRELRSLDGAMEWINSPPLTAGQLLGRVVLIQFWTYTCINWLRTESHVRAWAEKYRDQGLVAIGVHTPEFTFEHRIENVRRAAKDLRVAYPIVVDNDYRIWSAFRNQAWPALYFVDAQGRVRHQHFGEGEYERSERMIQELLAESGRGSTDRRLVAVEGRGLEAAADWNSLRSPETYLGYQRTTNFASPGGPVLGQQRAYMAPARLSLNHWALAGDWTMEKESARLNSAHGRIVYRFHARDLHLVMGLKPGGQSVRFRVLVDGRPPGGGHGLDVDEQGYGNVADQRLYQLIRQPQSVNDRQFEIEFLQLGVEIFAFTFG